MIYLLDTEKVVLHEWLFTITFITCWNIVSFNLLKLCVCSCNFRKLAEDTFFSIATHFIVTHYISLVNVQTNYCNINLLFLVDVKQLNEIMKRYCFYTSTALWDGQGKIKMYYGMSRVTKQLLGRRSIMSWVAYQHNNTLFKSSICMFLHWSITLFFSKNTFCKNKKLRTIQEQCEAIYKQRKLYWWQCDNFLKQICLNISIYTVF